MASKSRKKWDLAQGIADMTSVEIVPRPHEVYQLEGYKPDVATLAYGLEDARSRIAVILGVKALDGSAKVVRIH